MEKQPGEVLANALDDSIKFARAAERSMSIASLLKVAVEAMGDFAELDPEVTPEVRAMLDAVQPAVDALQRLGKFIEARLDARLAAAVKALGELE